MMDKLYQVRLEEIFEGPMDLLIHLIKKNEVDIYDIPVALITRQYIEYIDWMKMMNVDFAGDFLVMASTLAQIKSRTLLPTHGNEDDDDDPRMEIARPLLEYLQMKSVADQLAERDLLGEKTFVRTYAQEEFKDALTRIKEITNFDGGDLEAFYKRLKSSYEDCDARAEQIEKRIDKVETVAADLFVEWQKEIDQMNDRKLKTSSRVSLADAKAKYQRLSATMNQSTKGMYPVLAKLNDYVLYLKHNLNARAVGALGGEVVSIEKDVESLIKDMNRSILEAENFIKTF